MKINDLTHNIGKIANLETTANRQKDQESNTSQAAIDTPQSVERVELSNMSFEYSKATEKMEVAPVERVEKIEKLRMQVQNGSYNVNSANIADKIVNDTLFNVSD
jgi:flagellar biosynthesis anti-sigma factor FlgM